MSRCERLRILLLAPGSNPKILAGGIIGFSLAEALAQTHQVTLAVRVRDEQEIIKANGGFHAIESFQSPCLDRLYNWIFRRVFKEDRGNVLWTAIRYPLPLVFEWKVWRRLRNRICAGEYDVVLRILEIVPMIPSALPFLMRKCDTPFVIGPLNGGLPWPKGFDKRQQASSGSWAIILRRLYRYLPFARSTYARAKAIIAGSSHTFAEFSKFRDKLFYMPGENGIRSSLIETRLSQQSPATKRLEIVSAGRLVSLKAFDLALRGAAGLLRTGNAHVTILGEGPERTRLEALVAHLGISENVTFLGWVSHSAVLAKLRESDLLLFPSIKDFGGGVVFEAIALGAVPVVADYGGPGDIVSDNVGYRIRLDNEIKMVEEIESVLERLSSDRDQLEELRQNGLAYARESLTWESKARMLTKILLWATRTHPKPSSTPPKSLPPPRDAW